MPAVEVVFYRDGDGSVPVLEWLRDVLRRDRRGFAKCLSRIRRLSELGHDLRRPECDYVGDGIYELRARHGTVNYRILYFHHRDRACVLAHGLTKEDRLPPQDVARALTRKARFEANPEAHIYEEPDIAAE